MVASARGWLAAFVREPRFLEKYPYYAAVLALLEPVHDPSVKQMAVSFENGRFYLHVNQSYFAKHPDHLAGILLHEVHHIVLGHLTHPKFRDVADREAMEMAMEMAANEYVEEALPDPIVWKPYARFGMKPGMSTMERYEVLAALHRAHKGALDAKKPTVDDHGPWAKVPVPPGGVEATRGLIEQAVAKVASESGDRAGEGPRKRERVAGREPGRLVEDLVGVSGRAREPMDWKTALAMFVVHARAPVHTYARPNRRFPSRVGEVPGRTYSPRVITKPHLLVVIDTSSSMTGDELAEVARQLTGVAEHARITVVECDTEITRVYPFDGRIDRVEGRGGTDLRPIFDPAFLAAHRADGVVYFTDGQGPFAERAPPVRTLWVLTKREGFACPWGERVEMNRAGTRAPPPR
jgi:predicted metal-dependent peptidase